MAYWSTSIRDRYLEKYNIEVNPVYEKYGLKRCGCVMCPMASDKERQKEAKLFPKYAENFERLCERIIVKRQDNAELSQFRNGGGTHYSKRTYTLLAKTLYLRYISGFSKKNKRG